MKQGDFVPGVVFKTRVRDESIEGDNPFRWEDRLTDDYFGDKRVLLISLPGAFTPTCSLNQVPAFDELYDEIRALGVDDVYIMAVNDPFTMRKWMLDLGVKHVKWIPDGNGEFTEKAGMLVDFKNRGFGQRSWRYAAVVNDGIVEKVFVEPGRCENSEADPYVETTPDTVMAYLKETWEA